jgi:glycosyltransferase involved in cell wall biosynthesis
LKFCLIGPIWPYRGGISHNSALVSKALVDDGHEICVISFRRQYPKWLYPGKTDQDNSKNPLKAPAKYILDPISPSTWKKAAQQALSFGPDLVLIQWWTFFWAIPFAWISRYIFKKGIRVAYLIHNVSSHEAHPLDRIFTRLALSAAQDFLVFSSLEEQHLKKLLPKRRIAVTHLPVYSFENSSSHTKISARNALNLPVSDTILLFFGLVRPYKGLDFLLKALVGLKRKGLTPYLAIVGEFWKDKHYYIDFIGKSHIQDQIRIEDRYVPNEEADLWFRAADVLIAPYTAGVTQSAVASLALGYGLPMIITTEVAQGLENIDNQTIRVIPPDNIGELEVQISQFINELPTRTNITRNEKSGKDSITQAILSLVDDAEWI